MSKKARFFRHATIAAFLILFITSNTFSNEQNQGKTKEEVDSLIKQAGTTSPDWWDSVELKYPETLDTAWPVQQGVWEGRGGSGQRGERGQRGFGFPGQRGTRGTRGQAQIPTNIDQYLMQVVYLNSAQHKQGIKLISHLMTLHKDDAEKYNRDMSTLGYLYYDLTMDYARAAYYWQQSEQAGGTVDNLKIARCYYELGSKEAAADILTKETANGNSRDVIKLWATIGDVDKAIEMAQAYTSPSRGGRGGGNNPQLERDMLAAEICRQAGRYDEAIEFYKKVADAAQPTTQNRGGRGGRGGPDGRSLPNRAKANIEGINLFKVLDLSKVPDGSYTGSGTGHEGNLTVEVTIKSGKIDSVKVTQQRETPNRFVMAEPITRKIVANQGIEDVDAVTAATETSDAIINAVAKAILQAMED